MTDIKYIAIHNTGGLGNDPYASTQHLTWQDINNAHRDRWSKDFPGFFSRLSNSTQLWGGYNVFINKDGEIKQFRAVGEETGAQIGHNFDTISICLAGNFSLKDGTPVDQPTDKQRAMLTLLLQAIWEGKTRSFLVVLPDINVSVPFYNILPHRLLQVGKITSCFGDALPDSWGQDLLKPYLQQKLNILQQLLLKLMALLTARKQSNLAGMQPSSCLYESHLDE